MDWQELIVSQAVATFLTYLKGLKGVKKKTAKKMVLKVFTSIRTAYADDKDFE